MTTTRKCSKHLKTDKRIHLVLRLPSRILKSIDHIKPDDSSRHDFIMKIIARFLADNHPEEAQKCASVITEMMGGYD